MGFLDGLFPAIALGDPVNARELVSLQDTTSVPPAFQLSFDAVAAFALGSGDVIEIIEHAIAVHVDPEPKFMFGVMLVRRGAVERGLDVVAGAVAAGYSPVLTLDRNKAFDTLRGSAAFRLIHEDALRRMRSAQDLFEAAGGPEMLGLPAPTRLA